MAAYRRSRRPSGVVAATSQVTTKEPESVSPGVIKDLSKFLEEKLPVLFTVGWGDEETSKFEEKVDFEDPITKYGSLQGYQFNIAMLRFLFKPDFQLRSVYQSGPSEITTRWTMSMDFRILPWRPEVVFTGLSIYGISPETSRFVSHIDVWDSINEQAYFSREGLMDLISQASHFYTTTIKPTSRYQILTRRARFEVREYEPYVVAQGQLKAGEGPAADSSNAYKSACRLAARMRTEPGVPAITTYEGQDRPSSAQAVLPIPASEIASWPAVPGLQLLEVPGGVVAAARFSGNATEEKVRSVEKELRSSLLQQGLQPMPGSCFKLARYNEPWAIPFFVRNEVIVDLKEFKL